MLLFIGDNMAYGCEHCVGKLKEEFVEKYGGEFFPSRLLADGSRTFVEFFQTDKETGKRKGIIRIQL